MHGGMDEWIDVCLHACKGLCLCQPRYRYGYMIMCTYILTYLLADLLTYTHTHTDTHTIIYIVRFLFRV